MSDSTYASAGGKPRKTDPRILAVMPTGAEVHDAIMAGIEADLTTRNLPALNAKYAGEAPEQRKARTERYKVALKKYDKAYAEWVNTVRGKVDSYKRTVLSQAKASSSAKDEGEISRLESEISGLSDQ